jgi:uncharacterized membrane protein
MIDFVYNVLAAIGYQHPIHAPTTHIPMGMAIGGFIFSLVSFKKPELSKTAHYCIVLALIAAPVVSILGIMDWQHRYMGSWTNLIIAKMIFAVIFMVFLGITVYLYRKGNVSNKVMFVMYVLCLASSTVLGFIGGQIIFG